LNNSKLINPKLICAFCWFVLFFNYENARSKKQNKVLRHVSILIDHHQGVCVYLAKVTEYLKIKKKLKSTEFKILNSMLFLKK